MAYYSYIVVRDYGFAPNPFYGFCTLATCKPQLRKIAQVGDWIFGTGSKQQGLENQLIFAMRVCRRVSYDEYWNGEEFQFKKPVMNGSLKQMYGDNIYHFDQAANKWIQADSHHSYDDGEANPSNLKTDTRYPFVLISCPNHFYYLGRKHATLPEVFIEHICDHIGHNKLPDDIGEHLLDWLAKHYEPGYQSDPILFEDNFERFEGK